MGVSPAGKRRLQKEYAAIEKAPPPYILARPREDNLWETHFIIRGPEDSVYAGGEYWGTLSFPDTYPFAPPGIKLMTASGRFQTNRDICTSMSNFHPGSWNPSWSIETILTGLLSFMLDHEMTTGSIKASESERKQLAAASHSFNISQTRFKTIFPEYAQPIMRDLPNMAVKERNLPPTIGTSPKTTQSVTPSLPVGLNPAALGPDARNNGHQRFSSIWLYAGVCVVFLSLFAKFVG